MNNHLDLSLADMVSGVSVNNLLANEIPEAYKEVLMYEILSGAVASLICTVGFIVFLTLLIISIRRKGGLNINMMAVGIIGGGNCLIGIICNLGFIKAWLAPKAFLIEYIAKLAN